MIEITLKERLERIVAEIAAARFRVRGLGSDTGNHMDTILGEALERVKRVKELDKLEAEIKDLTIDEVKDKFDNPEAPCGMSYKFQNQPKPNCDHDWGEWNKTGEWSGERKCKLCGLEQKIRNKTEALFELCKPTKPKMYLQTYRAGMSKFQDANIYKVHQFLSDRDGKIEIQGLRHIKTEPWDE